MVQQSLIYVRVLQELPKCGAKISQMASQVHRFQQTHAPLNLQAFRFGEFARTGVIEQYNIRAELFGQNYGAELPNP
jgi:hypothetical protein